MSPDFDEQNWSNEHLLGVFLLTCAVAIVAVGLVSWSP
jgi:hypothetical protein